MISEAALRAIIAYFEGGNAKDITAELIIERILKTIIKVIDEQS